MEEMKKKIALMEAALRSAESYLCEDLDAICDDVMREYAEDTLEEIRKGLKAVEEVKAPKVYVLFTEDVIDFDPYRNIEMFSSKEKAMEAFDDYCRKVKSNIKEKAWEIERSEGVFDAYKSFNYAENRVYAKVYELEAK